MSKQREKRFNGKPMSHWERMAKELVVSQLVRASQVGGSLPGDIASKRLLEMAEAEDPVIFKQVLEERRQCREGLAAFVQSFSRPSRRRKAG